MAQTTIKVDTDVRDRLAAIARRDGVTLGELLERLLAEQARRDRFDELRAAMSRTPPAAGDLADDELWERTMAADLDAAR